MRFYQLEAVELTRRRYKGEYRAEHPWMLPGIRCPACHAVWGGVADAWPCVDLSGLKDAKTLGKAHLEEDYAEFERLQEQVRPLVPPGMPLWPGTQFGPLTGRARGHFGQLFMQYGYLLLIQREALEQLQARGLRGLTACPTALRFRQKSAPELWELQIEPHGMLHPECIPPDERTPCARCGRWGFTLPKERLLDRASLPEHLDLFRLIDASVVIVASERLVDAIHHLGLEEVAIRELPLR
jgi:uncharacterized double-CXXCG motif protein